MSNFDTANYYYLTTKLVDVSAANNLAFTYVPETGDVVSIRTALAAAITGADSIVTFSYVDSGGVSTAIGTLTVTQSGSAEGDLDSVDIPTKGINIKAGGYLKAITDGASSTTSTLYILYTIRR